MQIMKTKLLQEKMSLKKILILRSGSPPVWCGKTIYEIMKDGIMGNIHVKLYEIWTGGSKGNVVSYLEL